MHWEEVTKLLALAWQQGSIIASEPSHFKHDNTAVELGSSATSQPAMVVKVTARITTGTVQQHTAEAAFQVGNMLPSV